MDSTRFKVNCLRQDITEHNLQLKALIQDINACEGPLAELKNLNGAGRSKISSLRKFIDSYTDIAKDIRDEELLREVVLYREQLSTSMDHFKDANIKSMNVIETRMKEMLLKKVNDEDGLRMRQKRDKEGMAKMTSSVTDQLLSISRQLADTTKRSAETLDSLAISSDNVVGTQEELKSTSGTITQSGKLLAKYGRREFTDKIIVFFAFAFFAACVIYIVQKRVF